MKMKYDNIQPKNNEKLDEKKNSFFYALTFPDFKRSKKLDFDIVDTIYNK